MESNCLLIPNTGRKIYEGAIVILNRLPNLQWILRKGYYNYGGTRYNGWFFSSIPSDTQMPVFAEDLANMIVKEEGQIPEPIYPPIPPCPPGPFPPAPEPLPFTPSDKKQLDEAMLTFETLEDRDKFSGEWLVNGKLVRVNDSDGEGHPEYYTWNSETSQWDLASFGYRYMTREEIGELTGGGIVSIVWSDNNGSLVCTSEAGVPSTVLLEGVANNPYFNPETRTVKISVYGQEDFTFTLPRNTYLRSMEVTEWDFGEPTGVQPAIVATVSDGTLEGTIQVPCDISSIKTVYTGGETSTVTVSIDGQTNEVTASVRISANENNILQIDPEGGLFVDGSDISGGGSLQSDLTAAITVGGIDAGDQFTAGTSYDDLWNALLNPVLYPTFTAPSASLSYSADSLYKVGTTIAAKTGTVTYNAGAIMLNGVKQNNRGGAATGYSLSTSGADTEYSGSSESSGSFNVTALTRSTKGSITLTGTVTYSEGPQPKDSKGQDYGQPLAAGSVTSTKTLTFILPYYYGVSNTSSVSDFTGLTENLSSKGQKQFKFTTNNQYMVIAYDSSYGNLTSIIDPNGFETISGWTKSTLTVDGFSYFVYVANSATTDTNAQFTFKY